MGVLRRRKLEFFFASLAWAGTLLALSLQPNQLLKKLVPVELLFSLAHVVFYGILAWLLCGWFRFQRQIGALRFTDTKVFIFAFTIALGWGAVTEWLQFFRADRHAEWQDMGWNVAGVILGLAAFYLRLRHTDWNRK